MILGGLGPEPAVLDVGAGTGISTAALVAAGARAIALEPNDEMRAVALAKNLDARAGSAIATALPSASVDLVTAFQAFHWFASAQALAEFRRVLRPGGRLAIVWNERDRTDPFSLDFRAIEERYGERSMLAGIDFSDESLPQLLHDAGFGAPREGSFAHFQELDAEGVAGRIRSTSYAPRTGPLLDALLLEIRALRTLRGRRGYGQVALSHRRHYPRCGARLTGTGARFSRSCGRRYRRPQRYCYRV